MVPLVRRDDPVLGERWDLAREEEAGEALDGALERLARGDIALSSNAARALRGEPKAVLEGARSLEIGAGIRMLPVRTPTLPPATHTNLFVVGDREAVIVEPASPHDDELERVAQWIGALEREGLRPREILLTHHHIDHVGGAQALSAALGLPIAAHAETASRVAAPIARTITDGERIDLGATSLVAIHTPGHAPGHLCFLETRSRVMLAGDMVAGTGTILIEPSEGDMELYLASLAKMAAYDPSALAPAHGGVLRPARAVIDRYRDHRLAREAKVLAALRSLGEADASDLVPLAYDEAPSTLWPLARLSTEAHLIKLEREGLAKRRGAGWAAA